MPQPTMRAVRYERHGGPDVLRIETLPRPRPGENEVLVRVHAAGVNPIDWKIRQGYMSVPLPATPGIDLAGTVEETGPGVRDFEPGQEVFGAGRGAYAEYAVAAAADLAPKPRNLGFTEAAAVPIGARTAWLGLFEAGDLQPGQKILVHGAAGGVGLWAVQLGRWKAAHVTGTASAENLEFVTSLGADRAIDYVLHRFEDEVRDLDLVFDTVGGDTQERSWSVLRPGGILVTIVGQAPDREAKEHGMRAARVGPPKSSGEILSRIGDLIESGILAPTVQAVYPLEQARDAQELCETGHGRGRIVLAVAG